MFASRELLHAGHAHSRDDGDGQLATSVLTFKLVGMMAIFFATIGCAFIPFRLQKSNLDQEKVISYSNCLSGGIFLGFAFIHVLPYSVSDFRDAAGDVADLHIVYILCLLGFFSVLAVERILYTKIMQRDAGLTNAEELKVEELNVNGSESEEVKGHSHSHHHGHFHTHDVPFGTNSKITPYIVTGILCFHSIFEGLGFGMQRTLTSTGVLFAGIFLHKCGEAFSMGVSFLKSDIPKKIWLISLITFASVIPIFTGVGLALTQLGDASLWISSLLGAFAAGAFMYISILGVITEEFSSNNDLWRKFGLVMLGIFSMCVISGIDYFA